MEKGYGNYDKFPETRIFGWDSQAFEGYEEICRELDKRLGEAGVLVCEIYPGMGEELLQGLLPLGFESVLLAEEAMVSREEYERRIAPILGGDRVFGKMTQGRLEDFFLAERLEAMREKIRNAKGRVLVYGAGASLISKGDCLVYGDLARWEIQLRYRRGMGNFHGDNGKEPQLSKYKRGFFLDWRLADRQKQALFEEMDYVVDGNLPEIPKMLGGEAFRQSLCQLCRQPFRLVPYFDPGVWGGQWMKSVCGLPSREENFAWSFDGVPEENSLYLRVGKVRMELPAMDLVLYQGRELLGGPVADRFGLEFPIRFDLLDTVGGQNLSLQVHPVTEYIQKEFGMKYTQDESYYILDCPEEGGFVYLGLREGVSREEFMEALSRAQTTGELDAERYVNKIPVKKHDHVLIPAGTVHCSGKDTMVLEISATPYIFTFKLWDWGRLGLDGLPRPIHLNHGEKNIQWERDTSWVMENLIHREKTLWEKEDAREERTGLHELEFIETRRHTFTAPIIHPARDGVRVMNLVEGEAARITSPAESFPPFVLHYGETVILPAAMGAFTVEPEKATAVPLKTITAFVRE